MPSPDAVLLLWVAIRGAAIVVERNGSAITPAGTGTVPSARPANRLFGPKSA